MQPYIFSLAIVLIMIGYQSFFRAKSKKAIAGMGPAMHQYFLRSGFRYPDMAPEPVEAHVLRAMNEAQQPVQAGDKVIHYVRDFHGLSILFEQAYRSNARGSSISVSWSTQLRTPPRIPFQIADRSHFGAVKAVREALSHTTRDVPQRFPHPVQTGIPQFDSRFMVYGHDPNAVAVLLQQNPALVAALMNCVEVDMWIDQRSCVFADPAQKNLNAAMGGTLGQMAMGIDYGKRFEMLIPLHESVCEIIASAVRASA